jgi:hypothetical protein
MFNGLFSDVNKDAAVPSNLVLISRGAARLVVRGEHYRRVSCWSDVDCRYLSRVANSLSVDISLCVREMLCRKGSICPTTWSIEEWVVEWVEIGW